ncbi:DNA polymerase lambda [Colletotrichum aenigma]|uniref:DNA polymerase lambda n=1 Tax=Colletotrichum aenigma TaxID=1215731 RepID=UPI001872BA68|nr:DNA polymerase lambda [Colletotrichum aenigma]KAF5518225.1 DNA polymerase lambda [Colletotrichum aenigma]
MTNTDTPLRDKARFFHHLDAIGYLADDDDDDFEEAEEQHRRQLKAFQAAAQPRQPLQETSPVVIAPPSHPTLTGTTSAPTSTATPFVELRRKDVIERTPLAEIKGPGRKDRGAPPAADTSFVEDTPIPDSSSRQPLQPLPTLTRIAATPLPAKRHLLAHVADNSPSMMAMKKRKREPSLKLVPEVQQVLRGMRLYFIPNDDIAPARKIRIRKSQEYGATWVRNLEDATHVIVDKKLEWKNIEKILSSTNASPAYTVVTEEYPLDCVRFKTLLNAGQKQYQVSGCPEHSSSLAVEHQQPQLPVLPLQDRPLKKRQPKPDKWDYAPPPSTPSRSQDSSGRRSEQQPAPDSPPVLRDITPVQHSEAGQTLSNQVFDGSGDHSSSPAGGGTALASGDELEGVISQLQRYRDLPLERDEDDLPSSDPVEPESECECSEDERQRKKQSVTKSSSRKDLTWEDKFACYKGGTKGGDKTNPNNRTIEVLQQMCDYYTRTNDTWRPIAYRKAITQLKRQPNKVSTAEEAIRLPGVGQRLADKIEEIVTTNRLQRLEHAESEPMDEILQTFLKIYGVGSVQASHWISQGFRTLGDLKQKAKLTANQYVGIDHYDDLNTRIPRSEVKLLGAVVRSEAAKLDPAVQIIIGGSYRRGADNSGDVDFLITKKGTKSTSDLVSFLNELVRVLESQRFLVARLASSRDDGDGSKWHGCCVLPKINGFNEKDYRKIWRRVDFLLVPETELGAALIYFTGNDIFNRSIRLLAFNKGMRLNQRGLYKDVMRGPGRVKMTEGELVEGQDERKIFEILGVKWREPHERWC